MGLRTKRLPEHRVTLNVYSGKVTPKTLMDMIHGLAPADAGRWINYLDPTVDLSGLSIASIPKLKNALATRLRKIQGDDVAISALVCATGANELFLRFWPSYVGLYEDYPLNPASFLSIEEACDWLGLEAAARQAVIEAVEAPARGGAAARETPGPQAPPARR